MNKILNTNTRKFKLHPSSEHVYQAQWLLLFQENCTATELLEKVPTG